MRPWRISGKIFFFSFLSFWKEKSSTWTFQAHKIAYGPNYYFMLFCSIVLKVTFRVIMTDRSSWCIAWVLGWSHGCLSNMAYQVNKSYGLFVRIETRAPPVGKLESFFGDKAILWTTQNNGIYAWSWYEDICSFQLRGFCIAGMVLG